LHEDDIINENPILKMIIVGCHKFVTNMEERWYRERLKPRKPSERQIAALSVLWPSFKSPEGNQFRPFEQVSKKFGMADLPRPYASDVNRGLKSYVNVGYFEKHHNQSKPGTNTVYAETAYVYLIKRMISDLAIRKALYLKSLQLGILHRYLCLQNYTLLLRYKYTDVRQMVKVGKAIGKISNNGWIEEYVANSNLTKDKNLREIYLVSCKLADMQLKEKNWRDDFGYTRFFLIGGISFFELVNSRNS
jgi:hypothetical protein